MDKEKTFEWNDELVSELLWSRFPFPEDVTVVGPILEEFKKEKLKRLKEEKKKPEVIGIEKRENVFLCHIHFSADNFKAIPINKERLAEILIAENWEPKTRPMDKSEVVCPEMAPVVSYKEYLQFGEDCFNAARKNNSEWYYRYKNFSDYMNSQKPKE